MKNLYFSDSSIASVILIIIVICGIGYYLGSKALGKIPYTNLKERLLKALDYSFFMFFVFFIVLMKFQLLHSLGSPNEFMTGVNWETQAYQSIQSSQIAHTSFYYVFLFWITTSYFLVRRALGEKLIK